MYMMTDLTNLFFSSTLKVLESFEEIHFEMRISIFLLYLSIQYDATAGG